MNPNRRDLRAGLLASSIALTALCLVILVWGGSARQLGAPPLPRCLFFAGGPLETPGDGPVHAVTCGGATTFFAGAAGAPAVLGSVLPMHHAARAAYVPGARRTTRALVLLSAAGEARMVAVLGPENCRNASCPVYDGAAGAAVGTLECSGARRCTVAIGDTAGRRRHHAPPPAAVELPRAGDACTRATFPAAAVDHPAVLLAHACARAAMPAGAAPTPAPRAPPRRG